MVDNIHKVCNEQLSAVQLILCHIWPAAVKILSEQHSSEERLDKPEEGSK